MGKGRRNREARAKRLVVLEPPPAYMDVYAWLKDRIRHSSLGTWRPSTRQIAVMVAAGCVRHESHPIRDRYIPVDLKPQLELDPQSIRTMFGDDE